MKLNFKTIYFALISLVSILAIAFSFVSFAKNMLYVIFPELVASDLQQLEAIFKDEERGIPPFELAELTVLWTDVAADAIKLVVFGILLIWHLPRLLKSND